MIESFFKHLFAYFFKIKPLSFVLSSIEITRRHKVSQKFYSKSCSFYELSATLRLKKENFI
jgi:hypothetical protein